MWSGASLCATCHETPAARLGVDAPCWCHGLLRGWGVASGTTTDVCHQPSNGVHTEIEPDSWCVDGLLGESCAAVDRSLTEVLSTCDDQFVVAPPDGFTPQPANTLTKLPEEMGRVWFVEIPEGTIAVRADAGLIFKGEQTLEIWDPRTQETLEVLPGPFAVATHQNQIVACGPCDQLELIDLDTGTQRTVDMPTEVASVDGYGGAFSPDGQYLAAPAYLVEGNGVVLVDFASGESSLVPGMTHPFDSYPQVAWSPDGEWLFYSVGGLTAETGRLFAYRPGDATAYEVPVTLDHQYYGMATD